MNPCSQLGAGTAQLACSLASHWSSRLKCYTATDIPARVEQIREMVAASAVVCAAPLTWGELLNTTTTYDLIICSDLLYYNGADIFEQDQLEPLASTLAAAMGCRTLALCSFRVRDADREAAFASLCREHGLYVEACEKAIVAVHSPAVPLDVESTGALALWTITKSKDA